MAEFKVPSTGKIDLSDFVFWIEMSEITGKLKNVASQSLISICTSVNSLFGWVSE